MLRRPSFLVPALAGALLFSAPGLAQDRDLGDLMADPEAARPGPSAGDEQPEGTGSAITRSLSPDEPGPPFGVGVMTDPPVEQALEQLREAHAAVGALQQEVSQQPDTDLTGTDLGQQAQQVLTDTQLAIQALQHSEAVPSGSQEVRDALTLTTESQNRLLSGQDDAAEALAQLHQQLGLLTTRAEQAMTVPRTGLPAQD